MSVGGIWMVVWRNWILGVVWLGLVGLVLGVVGIRGYSCRCRSLGDFGFLGVVYEDMFIYIYLSMWFCEWLEGS